MSFLFFSEHIEGFDQLWILGDEFLARPYIDHVKNSDYQLYMKSRFEVFPICNSKASSNNTSILSRIENEFIAKINEKIKLPAYILVVLDDDFIQYLKYDGYGISECLCQLIKYLAQSLAAACHQQKKMLPLKAVKEQFPMFYWATLPQHKYFQNRTIRAKFNNCLESVLKLHNNMRQLKMKEIWSYDNPHLVNMNGHVTSYRLSKYWASIDAALEFNVDRHEQFLCKETRLDFQAKK